VVIEDRDLVTVPEAARLLRVSTSTVRRLIDRGQLPSYRVGQRSVRLNRRELGRALAPVAPSRPVVLPPPRKPTREESEAWLEALDKAREFRERLLESRGGVPFPDSVDLINAGREERTRQIMDSLGLR
jgi:excisionase family DNA binding protein